MQRSLTRIAAGAVVASLVGYGTSALAQDYPNKSVSVIVPFGAGGQTDIASRTLAEALAEQLGQNVAVVNRGGAGGSVGTAEMAAASPDGYTLGVTASTPLMLRPFVSDVPYTVDDFTYICRVFENPLFFTVEAGSEIDNPQDLAEYAKSNTMRYGSSGVGSAQHLTMLQFAGEAGVEAVHVPNNSDAENLRNILADVITGTLTSSSVVKQNADTIKPIGVAGRERSGVFPDVPTFAEQGYDVYRSLWGVLVGPEDLPDDITGKLRTACKDAQATDAFQAKMRELGMEPAWMDGTDFEPIAKEESASSKELLTEAGVIQ